MALGVNVKSEVSPLKRVLLHRPGKELSNLVPCMLDDSLFGDIPFLRAAQEEHDAFANILRAEGIELVYLEDIMAEVLDLYPELREKFINQFMREAGIRVERDREIVFDHLNDTCRTNKDLVLKTMGGIDFAELRSSEASLLVDLVPGAVRMVAEPMPNLYFTRDPFAVVGEGVSVSRMRSSARSRETLYAEYLFRYHPELQGVEQYYSRCGTFRIEGGDILNLSDELLAVGVSQRTEPDAIDNLVMNVFASESSINTVLVFNISRASNAQHLDSVLAQLDYGTFAVRSGLEGVLSVLEVKPDGRGGVRVRELNEPLDTLLAHYLDRPVELIPCGGSDRIAAEREQWSDGLSVLCLRPGTLVAYDRNNVTNSLLRERGFTVLEVPSAELSRGRGGPHCMSMPLWREGS